MSLPNWGDKEIMAQMKKQNGNPEKELHKMEITNLSDAEFKMLVIRMLRELTEYGKNMREEMKATLGEIKKNLQGTNSEGKEAGIQINGLDQKEELNIQPGQNEQRRIQENERLRNFRDNFKHSNIWIIGVPEEEEEETENLFEKIMEVGMAGVWGSSGG